MFTLSGVSAAVTLCRLEGVVGGVATGVPPNLRRPDIHPPLPVSPVI